jgi:predicted ATPase
MTSDHNDGVCLIRRVVIRNYKSIAACDVELGPLTFLVGPNGSGKSNFLDALRFVSDALRSSLEHALRDRTGINQVLRQPPGNSTNFAIRLDFQLPPGNRGHYAFLVKAVKNAFIVQHEECSITDPASPNSRPHFYRVSEGIVLESTLDVEPAAVQDRLYLANLSGIPAFRPLYDALSTMGFYNLNPGIIRELQTPGSRELLARDGSNLPSVLEFLSENAPLLKSRIEEYLSQVVPGITFVDAIPFGPRETLAFGQQLSDGEEWPFLANNMSDGTLRAIGVLVALFQRGADVDGIPLLVGIEEPETALHPAAVGVLIDGMRDAATVRQVLVTSHSPELLNNRSVDGSEILAVVAENGETIIGRLDEAGRSVLRDHLFTAGDLLRMNQLRPDLAAGRLDPSDVVLFGTGAPA